MQEHNEISYKEAVERLKRFGITDEKVYLVGLILLIEMIWADGQAQQGELDVLEDFLEQHVDKINKRAGCRILELQDAKKFVKPYIDKRPSPESIKSLRELVKPVCFTSEKEINENLKEDLLYACMDIAAISVTEYPFGLHERFNEEEKRCFFKMLHELS